MKKAELSMQFIILAILGLVVLIVMIVIFNTQIRDAAKKYLGFGDDAKDSAAGKTCVSLFNSKPRQCAPSCDATKNFVEVPAASSVEGWKDCGKGILCCEKTS